MNKKAITTQVLVFIIMMILMVGIIIFGISRMSILQDTISQNERLEVQNKMNEIAEFCTNTLNKGSTLRRTFSNDQFNGICIVDEELPEEIKNSNIQGEVTQIVESGDSVLFINAEGDIANDNIASMQIVDSTQSRTSSSQCWFGEEEIEIEITC